MCLLIITNFDLVSNLLQANSNYFSELEEIAAQEAKLIDMKLGNRFKSMIAYLKKKFSIDVELAEEGFIENFSKRFYKEKKLLKISNTLSRESKEFMVAQQIGLLVAEEAIEKQLNLKGNLDENGLALGRTVLANYFASALLMPYDLFGIQQRSVDMI